MSNLHLVLEKGRPQQKRAEERAVKMMVQHYAASEPDQGARRMIICTATNTCCRLSKRSRPRVQTELSNRLPLTLFCLRQLRRCAKKSRDVPPSLLNFDDH